MGVKAKEKEPWVWPRGSTYERLPKGRRCWEPCAMTDVRMALGSDAKRVERGEELTSPNGVRYRRVASTTPPPTGRKRKPLA